MEIFNIIFTILIVCTFGLQRNSEGLSLQTCNVLKGMSILAVFVGHTSKLFTGFVLYKLYCSIGLFAVSLFFFISGYGLMYGYMHKENCTAGFARKRIVPILVAYLIACIMHYLLNGHQIVNIQSLILCAYVPFSWFIFSIISLYIMYLLSVSISKKSKMAEGGGCVIASLLVFILIYSVISLLLEAPYPLLGGHQMVTFVIGMLVAWKQDKVFGFVKKTRYLWLVSFVILWNICLLNKHIHLPEQVLFLIESAESYVFPLVIIGLLFSFKVIRLKKFWGFFQSHSLQIYLVHGIVLELVIRQIDLPSEILIFLIFFITVLMAFSLKFVTKKIIDLIYAKH